MEALLVWTLMCPTIFSLQAYSNKILVRVSRAIFLSDELGEANPIKHANEKFRITFGAGRIS